MLVRWSISSILSLVGTWGGLPEGVDAVVCDLLLEDEREGLAEVHVEDVEGVVLHHVRVEQRSVCAPEGQVFRRNSRNQNP